MVSIIPGNCCLQVKFGSFLGGPLQKYFLPMITSGPLKHVGTVLKFGEKAIFPFADDIATLIWHSCHSKKPIDEKWLNGKKDFKLYKGVPNGRHVILTSHVLATTLVAFCSNKMPPFVLLKVADASYQPVMEELCSEERYIDAEIFHKKMVAEKLKSFQWLSQNYLPTKSKFKPHVLVDEKARSELEFWVPSKQRTKFHLNGVNLLAYRMARTKRIIGKDFSAILNKRNRFYRMSDIRAMANFGKVMRNASIMNNYGAGKISLTNSELLNKFLKIRRNSVKNSKFFK
ncbi:uncharacterized protein NPIL_672871 [Nephila pilipes]|uniref:Uncharacterized protein n=1 Tax=Nephila pilipes TaxID=299642 RepID=A0A8X6N7U3_NEPPI|nr:uncharacterized protein NPIL_672871 [Nephila pilipes]